MKESQTNAQKEGVKKLIKASQSLIAGSHQAGDQPPLALILPVRVLSLLVAVSFKVQTLHFPEFRSQISIQIGHHLLLPVLTTLALIKALTIPETLRELALIKVHLIQKAGNHQAGDLPLLVQTLPVRVQNLLVAVSSRAQTLHFQEYLNQISIQTGHPPLPALTVLALRKALGVAETLIERNQNIQEKAKNKTPKGKKLFPNLSQQNIQRKEEKEGQINLINRTDQTTLNSVLRRIKS